MEFLGAAYRSLVEAVKVFAAGQDPTDADRGSHSDTGLGLDDLKNPGLVGRGECRPGGQAQALVKDAGAVSGPDEAGPGEGRLEVKGLPGRSGLDIGVLEGQPH